jgi:hypothetical protein
LTSGTKVSKSIIIVGKGPSVLKSTREFINSFDEVAICNFPPIDGYEEYLGEKADYHFFNAHDPNPYRREVLDNLGLKKIFNTHHVPHEGICSSFPNHKFKYYPNYGEETTKTILEKYGFHPSTGTQAFYYFVKEPDYTTISLLGFDFFKVGKQGYYYPPSEVQSSLRYLYSNSDQTPFDQNGKRVKENLHNSEKSEKFVSDMIKLYNKKLRIVKS